MWKTAYVIATIDFIAGNMSTRFFILISFNSLFFRSAHWQKEVEVSDEEDASSSEGTPYEQEIEETSEDYEVVDPRV